MKTYVVVKLFRYLCALNSIDGAHYRGYRRSAENVNSLPY